MPQAALRAFFQITDLATIDAVEHRPVNTINLSIAVLGVILSSLLALMFGWGEAGLAMSISLGIWVLAALSVLHHEVASTSSW